MKQTIIYVKCCVDPFTVCLAVFLLRSFSFRLLYVITDVVLRR